MTKKETPVFSKAQFKDNNGDFLPQGFFDHKLIKFWDLDFKWMSRTKAEISSAYKHPIPYVVLFNAMCDKVLMYERSNKGNESRLHGKLSIGIGGHIEHDDVEKDLPISSGFCWAAERELEEEVAGVHLMSPITYRGMVNWDGDAVGQVHAGSVYVGYVKPGTENEIKPIDSEIQYCQWESIAKLVFTETLIERMENWSKLILPAFL